MPKKVLREIDGKSVLQHTFERAKQAKSPYAVFIATDSNEELYRHACSFADFVYRTSDDIRCGTNRVATLARHGDLSKANIIVNVQADEIDASPELIDRLIDELNNDMTTDIAMAVIKRPKGFKPSAGSSVQAIMKDGKLDDLVRAEKDDPVDGFLEHIGIVAFKKRALFDYLSYDPSVRDRQRNNEYMTAVDFGMRIKVIEVEDDSISINTEEDIKKASKPKPRKRRKKKASTK